LGEKKYHIILLLLVVFCLNTFGQNNPQQSSDVENSSNTPAQIATPTSTPTSAQSEASRKRRRLRALNDSLRFAAQREIEQKAAQQAASAQLQTNPVVTPVTPPQGNTPPVTATEKSQNPFDILRGEAAIDNNVGTAQNKTSSASSLLDKETYSKNFIFWVFLVVLILMAFIVAGGRSAIRTAYQAVTSDNALRQIYKEPMGWGSIGYLSLYVMFWINTGIFAFLLMSYYRMKSPFGFGQFGTFMACVAGVSILIILKHAVLYLVAKVFPIEKEVRTYNFIIMTVGIILGLTLMPINIFVAYSDPKLSFAFVYLGIATIALAYLVRSLRSLPLAAPFLIDNRFHFLLYLCTVEIAPLLVLSKIVMGNF
jgi:Domain of unknown function (DUF4271)